MKAKILQEKQMSKEGKITRIISNLYTVETEDSLIYKCRARGKFRNDSITPLVGDFVVIDENQQYILEIMQRKNELKRPNIANVESCLIVTSLKDPDLSLNLLDKQLICIRSALIKPIIIFTKSDLLDDETLTKVENIRKYYESIGIDSLYSYEIEKIKTLIKNQTVVLTGQTGAGKSTLINKLDENLNLKTSPISKALGRGVHTTRHVELYKVANFFIADTPGFSALDIHLNKKELKNWYPEFENANCRFKDCEHDKETNCQIKELVEEKKIMKSRYENYIKFRGELK